MEEIKAVMLSLGARKSEVAVYVYLLRSGEPASVRDIVEGTAISEKTVRDALKDLIDRGFVRKVGKGRGTKYRAVSVRKLLSELKKKIQRDLDEIFSRLRSLG